MGRPTNGGRPVADGTYRVVVAVAGGNQKDAGSVELHRHFFPVRGPHGTRGPVGDFGALRATAAAGTKAST